MKQYNLRKEIIGEFVTNDVFGTLAEAMEAMAVAINAGIYDSLEIIVIDVCDVCQNL